MFRVLVLLGLLLSPLSAAQAETALTVTALTVQGQVRFQEPGSTEWRSLSGGTVLAEGSRVSTGPGASCELALQGGKTGTLKLKESSTLFLKGLSEQSQVILDNGALFTKLQKMKKEDRFEVRTPTAVATVRGTGWLQSPEKMEVFEGSVHVEGSGGEELDLNEGQSLPIDPTGDLGDIGPLSDESKSEWNEFSSSSEQPAAAGEQKEETPAEEEAAPQEENALTEEPFEMEAPDAAFREDLNEAHEDQKEIEQEEEAEQEDDDDGGHGGGNYLGGGGG